MWKTRLLIAAIVIMVAVIAYLILRWEHYRGIPAKGITVDGDNKQPPTTWKNIAPLKWWGWDTVVVLEVPESDARIGYRIGFVVGHGKPQLRQGRLHDRSFKMLVGRESPTFFAVNANGTEIQLRLVIRTSKDDVNYAQLPQH